MGIDDDPIELFDLQESWRDWLDQHHAGSAGVWLQIAKKGSGHRSVSYAEALELAICYGWIDGLKRPLDDKFFLQRFTPRRARSKWSQVNVTKATALIKSGRMKPAGLREIELAKADGRWDAAYPSHSTATVPDDLAAALDAEPKAREFFDTLNSTNRYAIIYRVQDAKRPETRASRIAKFVAMCAAGERLHP
ncbi:MAG: YdeI/OmpD-associated family protein [Nocardioidaceae bacterium]